MILSGKMQRKQKKKVRKKDKIISSSLPPTFEILYATCHEIYRVSSKKKKEIQAPFTASFVSYSFNIFHASIDILG